jgi:hypothetical protein
VSLGHEWGRDTKREDRRNRDRSFHEAKNHRRHPGSASHIGDRLRRKVALTQKILAFVDSARVRSTIFQNPRRPLMKVLAFVKATPNSEKGIVPSEKMKQLLTEMGQFNEKLVKAGVMKEADGLKPSSFGKRIRFSGDTVTVYDGPFAETKELVAGYWVWEVKSMEEAVNWARQCPNPMPGEEGEIELRPTNSIEDFAEFLTDEHRENFQRLQKKVTAQGKGGSKAKSKSKSKSKAKPAKRKPSRAKAKK